MNKPKINVIDLDNTLINYDSFRKLIKKEIYHLNISICFFTFLRILRLLSGKNYKKRCIININNKYDELFFSAFAKEIFSNINNEVVELINKNTDENTINILLSSSPNLFISELIKLFNWEGSGSYFFSNGVFFHMYKEGKLVWLKNYFPINSYYYNFAISDSQSDCELLSYFNSSILWTSL